MFFSVPVSSWAFACPAQNAAANARPIIRRCFIRSLPVWIISADACIHLTGIESNFRPVIAPRCHDDHYFTSLVLVSRGGVERVLVQSGDEKRLIAWL